MVSVATESPRTTIFKVCRRRSRLESAGATWQNTFSTVRPPMKSCVLLDRWHRAAQGARPAGLFHATGMRQLLRQCRICFSVKRSGSNESYVGRVLQLTLLSPIIVESILNGHQPADLSVDSLMRSFPTGWIEQQMCFSIRGRAETRH